jgi:acetyl esterase/lipase
MRCLFAIFLLVSTPAFAADDPSYTRQEDVIYGRKFGTALTMDVFRPTRNANGLGVIWVVSGGWVSDHGWVNAGYPKPFLDRGYTVFAVVHGCQPKYTIPEVIADMKRSVRFIKAHAKEYKIDPDQLGVTGGSAGGHLSLMLGTTSREIRRPKTQSIVSRARLPPWPASTRRPISSTTASPVRMPLDGEPCAITRPHSISGTMIPRRRNS